MSNTATSSKFFSIMVGGRINRPAKAQAGFLNSEGQPKGTPVDVTIKKGEVGLPNYSVVWGELVKDPKDKKLTGAITAYPWGDPRGGIIELRFLRNCTSISKAYQDERKLIAQDKDAEISLKIGVNNFDNNRDKLMIEFLKLHYQNSSNVSRDPGVQVAFENYEPTRVMKRNTNAIQDRQRAENIVINTQMDTESISVLASLFDLDPRQQTDLLYDDLLGLAVNHEQFLKVIDYRRDTFRELIMSAKDIGLLDVDKKDAIFLVGIGGSRTPLLEKMPSEGDKLEIIIDNFYLPVYFNALVTLKQETEKFKANLN